MTILELLQHAKETKVTEEQMDKLRSRLQKQNNKNASVSSEFLNRTYSL